MKVVLLTALITGIFAALASYQYELANTSKKLKNNKNKYTSYYFFVFLSVATLVCVSGLRYYVGADYGGYYHGYPRFVMEFEEKVRNWNEPGLAIIAKLLYTFSHDGAVFMFVLSAITISFFCYTISKRTDTYFFSIMLYIFSSCWTSSFSGARQYLASAILFLGHYFIYERKFIKYCVIVFIASSFHITALVMLPMYFLITQVLDLKKIVFIIVSGITLVFSYDFMFQLVGVLKNDTTSGTDQYAQNQIHPLRILIAFAPIILYFLLLLQNKGFTGTENFYMGFIFVRAALIFGTANSAYLNRIDIYFTPFLCIALSKLVHKFPKSQHFILKATILVLYFIVWYYIDASQIRWQWISARGGGYVNIYA